MKLEEVERRFLNTIRAKSTATTYRYGLAALFRFAAVDDTADLQPDLLEQFYLAMDGYSEHTKNTYLATARRFFTWLDAHDLLPFPLSKAVSKLQVTMGMSQHPYHHKKIDPEIPRIVIYYDELPLPEGQTERLILLRDRAIVHTLYSSGGRVSEVAALTREDVLDGRMDEAHITGKGGQPRTILFTPEAKRAIRAYIAERGDAHPGLFISHGRNYGKSLGRTTLWSVVKKAVRALDLHESTSPHSFRHYRATQLLNEGMPLELVQAYLGHQDIGTTRKIYAHTSTAVLRSQFEAYSVSARDAADLILDVQNSEQ